MNILITGGCGFIGSHLSEYHLNQGDHVVIVDNLITGSLNNIAGFRHHPNLTFIQADLLAWQDLSKYVEWADKIYHLAAILGMKKIIQEPLSVLKTNILSCEYLLDACSKKNKKARILIVSSSSVYGHRKKKNLNENDYLGIGKPWQHPAGYAISKLSCEAFATAYAQTFDMPIVIVRIFNSVGLRQTGLYGMVVPRFIEQACTNQPITVYGDGTQGRSFCDVRDTVNALVKLMEQTIPSGEVINVGNDKEISINELARLVRQKAKSHSEIIHVPFEEIYGKGVFDVSQRCPNVAKLYRYTRFKAQIPIEKTIEDLLPRA